MSVVIERRYRRIVQPRTRYWMRRWAWMGKKGRDFVLDGVEYHFNASMDDLERLQAEYGAKKRKATAEMGETIRALRPKAKRRWGNGQPPFIEVDRRYV